MKPFIRGVIALEDIAKGKVILRDVPLAAAIYGDETQQIPFGFEPGLQHAHSQDKNNYAF